MRTLALLLLALAGCNNHITTNCGDVDCLAFPTVKLHVLDAATGDPAPLPEGWLQPVFTVGGANLGTTCGIEQDGGTCTTWQFTIYGKNTIHITFPGYQPADVQTSIIDANSGCCPAPVQVME